MADKIESEIKDIVGELPKNAFSRPISHKDLLTYSNTVWPYIYLMNPGEVFENKVSREIIKTKNGWQMIRYANVAIDVSPGKPLFGEVDDSVFMKIIMGGGNPEGSGIFTGKGTVSKQTHDAISETIKVMRDNNWQGVTVVAGTDFMKETLLRQCEEIGLPVSGYAPTEEIKTKIEYEKRKRERPAELPEAEMIRPE